MAMAEAKMTTRAHRAERPALAMRAIEIWEKTEPSLSRGQRLLDIEIELGVSHGTALNLRNYGRYLRELNSAHEH